MAVEFVDLPIKHGGFPSFFVCLPEGTKTPFSAQPGFRDKISSTIFPIIAMFHVDGPATET